MSVVDSGWRRARVVAFVCLLGLLSARLAAQTGTAARPNFLVITCEDMSPDLGCYGDPAAITPNLDALARKGNRYTAAFANGPICSPARTALLFSMYQTSLGAGNHRSRANTPEGLLGFATHLRAAGYFCTNHPKVDYNTPVAWEVERATYDRGRDWRARSDVDQPFLSIINIEVTHQSYTSVLPHEQYRERVRSRLLPEEVHDPADVVVPPYFPDTPAVRKELARYADCVTMMDRRVGEILSELEADGLAESTIVVFFSDHGAGHPRHKSTPFASGLRVPMIVYCPPGFEGVLRVPPGGVCRDLVTFIDIGPTLMNVAGVAVPASMHGVAVLGEGVRPREYAFGALDRRAESFGLSRTVTDGRYVYIRNYLPHLPIGQPKGYGFPSAIYQELSRLHRSGRLEGAALDYMSPSAPEMLFDLESDPYETLNLVDRAELRPVLDRLRSAHREQIRAYTDLNFVPESELARRAGDRAWASLAAELPLEDIYVTADLVGRGAGSAGELVRRLEDADPVVRWWAVVGLRNALQDGAARESAVAAIERALRDRSALVRIEAAGALLSVNVEHGEARRVLLEGIAESDQRLAHRAGRHAQLLRLNGDEFAAAVSEAAQRHRTEWIREVSAAIGRQRAGLE